jgi:hypothetical protein
MMARYVQRLGSKKNFILLPLWAVLSDKDITVQESVVFAFVQVGFDSLGACKAASWEFAYKLQAICLPARCKLHLIFSVVFIRNCGT